MGAGETEARRREEEAGSVGAEETGVAAVTEAGAEADNPFDSFAGAVTWAEDAAGADTERLEGALVELGGAVTDVLGDLVGASALPLVAPTGCCAGLPIPVPFPAAATVAAAFVVRAFAAAMAAAYAEEDDEREWEDFTEEGEPAAAAAASGDDVTGELRDTE